MSSLCGKRVYHGGRVTYVEIGMQPRALLWDFGDTLVDERLMQAPLEGAPNWREAWLHFVASPDGDRWMAGETDFEHVVAHLSHVVGLDSAKVQEHMLQCCRAVTFFGDVWEVLEQRHFPQAIVTVNPDIFTDVIELQYDLDQHFDGIVTSWEEGELDKGLLCEIARSRYFADVAAAECLLVDNRQDCCDAWRAQGGAAYHFRGESQFVLDLQTELSFLK